LTGPLIIVTNHINFLEVPLIYTHLIPRPVTGFVKAESWDNLALAYLFNLWEGIPLRRGASDVNAFQQALQALRAGKIMAITPEGTRSGDGRLKRGQPGIVILAQHSQAPILPIAYYGGEKIWNNLRRLQRTDFRISVGQPFTLKPCGGRITHLERQKITDEIMFQIAALLPPSYRGYYADQSLASCYYLEFIPISVNQSVAA
jgi:1-acyl-sn-glycerol-3-phosphate acyltransferase